MKRGPVLYVLMFVLFVTGILVLLNRPGKAGSILLIGAGLLSILFAQSLAEVQNQLNRFTWNPWGETRPFLFRLWGTAIVIFGVTAMFV